MRKKYGLLPYWRVSEWLSKQYFFRSSINSINKVNSVNTVNTRAVEPDFKKSNKKSDAQYS